MNEDEEGIVMARGSEKGDDGGVSGDLKSCGKDMEMKQMTTLSDIPSQTDVSPLCLPLW